MCFNVYSILFTHLFTFSSDSVNLCYRIMFTENILSSTISLHLYNLSKFMYLAKLLLIYIFLSSTPSSLCSHEKTVKPTFSCTVSIYIYIIFSWVISVIIRPNPKLVIIVAVYQPQL